MLVRSRVAQRMFDAHQVLLAAHKLLPLPGIERDETQGPVQYFHFMCDDHQIVFANGAPTESLLPEVQAMKALPRESVDEILEIFPELACIQFRPKPAMPIPENRLQRKLVERLAKNARAVLD